MKEIGGFLEFELLINMPYHESLIELNTGRNALLYLVKAKKIRKLYIPFYLCDSISNMLNKYNIEYEFYNIDDKFSPIFARNLGCGEYIYIVNYFGQIDKGQILIFKDKYKNIIMDNAHDFFQKPIKGIDTIYTCRKFFGVPDGAYLSTDILLDENLIIDKSRNRMKHVFGRFEGKASEYYSDFRENDKSFKELSLKKMSKLTKNIIGAIDYNKVMDLRNQNFKYLHDRLETINVLNFQMPEGPFAYPFYFENGIEIRKKLAKKNIYVPTLWPNVLNDNDESTIEYDYAANILPLPCDQRYDLEDMDRIVKELITCIS